MITLACPRCHMVLADLDSESKQCRQDGLTFRRKDGIWRMLLPGRAEHFAPFVRDYEAVRRSEGRSSAEASYYRSLPYHPSPDWRIRAKSFEALLKQVLMPLENAAALGSSPPRAPARASGAPGHSRSLAILDLGAGNGWLSNRLAQRGHAVAAVDLTINDFDGLGCRRFYETAFLPAQAEYDHLPFSGRAADLVIFNASLHYSTDIQATLNEALRVLDHSGALVILDSPVYHDPQSGVQMVSEREAQFTRQYGFASNTLKSENYLAYRRLDQLARELPVAWEFITPAYGLRWALRPILASVLRRREPAKFHLIVGRRR